MMRRIGCSLLKMGLRGCMLSLILGMYFYIYNNMCIGVYIGDHSLELGLLG